MFKFGISSSLYSSPEEKYIEETIKVTIFTAKLVKHELARGSCQGHPTDNRIVAKTLQQPRL